MSSGANNKDKMRTLIETTVVDRLKTIFRENEVNLVVCILDGLRKGINE